MIVFDLINDEAPLFIHTIDKIINDNFITRSNITGVTEGNRWKSESESLTCLNRLHFFDELDKQNVNIKEEINRISNEYNNFNIYACDRYLTQHKRKFQEKLLVYTYLFYEDLFEKNVTHYFTTGIAYTYNLVSYQVSLRFNVKHISFYGTRIGNRTAISMDVSNTFNEVNKMYENFSLNTVNENMYQPINDFVHKPKQPSYMKNAINASTVKMVFITEFFIRFNKFYFKQKHKYDLFTRNPFELGIFKLKKIINAQKINLFHNSIFDNIDYSDKYFIFPLHMQPEASTLILAPFNLDQKTTIINISKILPLDTILYVKEHRSALGQHSVEFYKELKKYPNIKLVSYKENMFNLIKKSIGTINLSSTVGLESLMLKKPSIVLGNVFYNDSGLTFKVDSYTELEKAINVISKQGFDVLNYYQNYEARLAYYIYCLNSNSYEFEFNVAKLDTKERVLRKENVHQFSECIKSILK
ncbi:hypothetical protein [Cellulophaga baltica]|uniref:capsular polysaccharide export protein, LipB/KpsS family n=1 Tax=Cellulophaga baltica TaxID=76594 RepID=UPI0024947545|nr:hypothetical protein [Cellulophaga baltica]